MPGRRTLLVHALILLAVWAAVYLPSLGSGGLTATEGHRAIPAFEMLDSGDWVVPRLFERAYLRKPPATMWAIASSAALFGQTEFAARLPSALAMLAASGLAFLFAGRWFGFVRAGTPVALGVGLAHLLLPWFWSSGRHAEIESLHNLGVAATAWLVLDTALVRWKAGLVPVVARIAAIGAASGLMMLAKGPAGVPVVIAMFFGACIAARSARRLGPASAIVGTGLVLGGACFAAWALAARSGAQDAVTQSPGAFLFEDGFGPGALARIAALAPSTLGAMFPVSLALLFPWGPDARREASSDQDASDRFSIGAAMTYGALLGLGALVLMGVSNVRYAMPVAAAATPVLGYALAALADSGRSGGLTPRRASIARAMLLVRPGRPAVAWVVLLVGASFASTYRLEAKQRAKSGREAGLSIAAAVLELPEGTYELRSDGLVEARPEVLWYASREIASSGTNHDLRTRWMRLPGDSPLESRVLLARRTDGGSGESALDVKLGDLEEPVVLISGQVHSFEFVVEWWKTDLPESERKRSGP